MAQKQTPVAPEVRAGSVDPTVMQQAMKARTHAETGKSQAQASASETQRTAMKTASSERIAAGQRATQMAGIQASTEQASMQIEAEDKRAANQILDAEASREWQTKQTLLNDDLEKKRVKASQSYVEGLIDQYKVDQKDYLKQKHQMNNKAFLENLKITMEMLKIGTETEAGKAKAEVALRQQAKQGAADERMVMKLRENVRSSMTAGGVFDVISDDPAYIQNQVSKELQRMGTHNIPVENLVADGTAQLGRDIAKGEVGKGDILTTYTVLKQAKKHYEEAMKTAKSPDAIEFHKKSFRHVQDMLNGLDSLQSNEMPMAGDDQTGTTMPVGKMVKYVDSLSDGVSASILVDKVVTSVGPNPDIISKAILPLVMQMQADLGTEPEDTRDSGFEKQLLDMIQSLGGK